MYNFKLIPQVKALRCTEGEIRADALRVSEAVKEYVPKANEIFPWTGSREIVYEHMPALGKEAYTVSVRSDAAVIGCSTPNGLYYGLATLKQLALLNEGVIPCCEIQDEPDMKIRGYSDDISRGEISTFQNFKDIIRRLSEVKCNLYMPYIEDTFQFDCIPQSGRFSDPVSKEEWRELVAYAKDYYVQITPIINVLGHWNKNASLADFQDKMLKNSEGRITGALDTRKPEVREMVCKMMDEAAEVFSTSEYLHGGGDEVGEYTSQFGKDLAREYYNGHFKMLNDHLKAQGRHLMMYCDMYTPVYGDYQLKMEAIDEMPDDILFVFWDYGCREHYDNIDRLEAHHKKFIVSPATHSWNRFLPHHYASWLNAKALASQSGTDSEGMLMSSWCDNGLSLREENWFGLYSEGLFAWSSQSEMSFDDMVVSFYKLFFGVDVDLAQYHALFNYDLRFLGERGDVPLWDWLYKRVAGGNFLCKAFFEPAYLAADPDLKNIMEGCRTIFEKGYAYFASLKLQRNQEAMNAFLFDLRRSIAAARKLELQKPGAYANREEAMADIPAWEAMAEEVHTLMEDNETVWMATNRQSEWLYAKSKYEDLYDSIQSVIRYCRYATRMTPEKHL